MTSTRARQLVNEIIENEPSKASTLLALVGILKPPDGGPSDEAVADDVLMYLYSKTDHCRKSMEGFIAESGKSSSGPLEDSKHLPAKHLVVTLHCLLFGMWEIAINAFEICKIA